LERRRGQSPNPDGLKTDYLWKRILTPARLTEILENYAQIVEEVNPKTGKKKQVQIFPRYHHSTWCAAPSPMCRNTARASAT
jgi:type I site-specific restriction-modification system R (restriction) subunit